jgi:hypothetical protein
MHLQSETALFLPKEALPVFFGRRLLKLAYSETEKLKEKPDNQRANDNIYNLKQAGLFELMKSPLGL